MTSSWREVDHTADLALEFFADSEGDLLVIAAVGLVQRLTGGVSPGSSARRPLSLDAIDPEDRLIRWLNEVLWLASGEGFLVSGASLSLRSDGLDATILGEESGGRAVSEIKAATYHDVRLTEVDGRWSARVVFDV